MKKVTDFAVNEMKQRMVHDKCTGKEFSPSWFMDRYLSPANKEVAERVEFGEAKESTL